MFNPERILGRLLTSGMGSGQRSGLGGLGSIGGASLGMGLLGAAVAAFEHYSEKPSSTPAGLTPPTPPPSPGQTGNTPPPPPATTASTPTSRVPPPPPFIPADPIRPVAPALVVLRIMIAAANADGIIDASEREAITQHAGGELTPEDQQGLRYELDHPQSLDDILPLIDPAHSTDCYAAALLAITVDNPDEQDFLDRLATGMHLDQSTRQAIQQKLGASS